MMRVEDAMNHPAIVCGLHDSAMLAAALMLEHDCGVIPIVNSSGRLVGILTDRDVCMAAYTEAMRLRDISISDIMTREVQYCAPTDSIRYAEKLMQSAQVRRLPVVDADGDIVGILSATDLLREAANPRSSTHPLSADDLVQTLATVSKPRRPVALYEPTGVPTLV